MKRDDGINREHRVGTFGFAIKNPTRLTVSAIQGKWRVLRGRQYLVEGLTFSEAIEFATAVES